MIFFRQSQWKPSMLQARRSGAFLWQCRHLQSVLLWRRVEETLASWRILSALGAPVDTLWSIRYSVLFFLFSIIVILSRAVLFFKWYIPSYPTIYRTSWMRSLLLAIMQSSPCWSHISRTKKNHKTIGEQNKRTTFCAWHTSGVPFMNNMTGAWLISCVRRVLSDTTPSCSLNDPWLCPTTWSLLNTYPHRNEIK